MDTTDQFIKVSDRLSFVASSRENYQTRLFSYDGYWWAKKGDYFKASSLGIHITTRHQTKDLIDWQWVEKSVAEIAKCEEEIFELSEEVMHEFFRTSNLYSYDSFIDEYGRFKPMWLTINYDLQHYDDRAREFEFTFLLDYKGDWNVSDCYLVVRLHSYSHLFVNGVRWELI